MGSKMLWRRHCGAAVLVEAAAIALRMSHFAHPLALTHMDFFVLSQGFCLAISLKASVSYPDTWEPLALPSDCAASIFCILSAFGSTQFLDKELACNTQLPKQRQVSHGGSRSFSVLLVLRSMGQSNDNSLASCATRSMKERILMDLGRGALFATLWRVSGSASFFFVNPWVPGRNRENLPNMCPNEPPRIPSRRAKGAPKVSLACGGCIKIRVTPQIEPW